MTDNFLNFDLFLRNFFDFFLFIVLNWCLLRQCFLRSFSRCFCRNCRWSLGLNRGFRDNIFDINFWDKLRNRNVLDELANSIVNYTFGIGDKEHKLDIDSIFKPSRSFLTDNGRWQRHNLSNTTSFNNNRSLFHITFTLNKRFKINRGTLNKLILIILIFPIQIPLISQSIHREQSKPNNITIIS